MMAKKKKPGRKSWRHFIVNGMPPPRYELLDKYSPLIDNIVDIVFGYTNRPKTLHFNFYKTLSYKVFGQTKVWTSHTYLLLRDLIDKLPNISEEDVNQQAWLYLLEMWSFYADNYNHNKDTRFVFYDYVRFNLIRYLSAWLANQILMSTADNIVSVIPEEVIIDESSIIKLDLGWVIVKSNNGRLKLLSTRQKYLIFLRYIKQITVQEIATLTQRSVASIDKDFSAIHSLLGIGG